MLDQKYLMENYMPQQQILYLREKYLIARTRSYINKEKIKKLRKKNIELQEIIENQKRAKGDGRRELMKRRVGNEDEKSDPQNSKRRRESDAERRRNKS